MAGVDGAKTAVLVNAGTPTNVSVIATPGADRTLVIQWVAVSNGAAAGEIKLLDGSGGTVLLDVFLPINSPLYVNCRRAPIVLTTNTALCCTGLTSTTSRINVGYSVELV
jgi:hypothetical protein